MSEMSTYLENALINVTLRNTSFTAVSATEVALFTTDPTDADTGTEVSGGSYARQAATWDAPTDGVTQNSATITFTDVPTATITHFGIYDPSGNLLYHSALDASLSATAGDTVEFDPGDLTVTLA